MKTLTGSALNLGLVKCNEKSKRYFWCPTSVVFSRPEIHVLGCAKHLNVGLSLSGLSSQPDRIHPILSASSFSSSETIQDEEMQIPDEYQSKTVHVKFQLQKECLFGQHFFIVGDDPIFGLWDPLKAIPLTWTDEHVWTVELDVPIGSLIKYKFILKGDKETILWQPGEDRVLQTWDTMKTITVIEDWDDSEVQKVIEEEPLMETFDKYHVVDSNFLMVAENLTQSSGNLNDDASFSISGEKVSSENPMLTIAANTTELKGEVELSDSRTETYPKESEVGEVNTLKTNGRSINGEHFSLCEDEFPVLVPGLIPMATLQTEESSSLDVADGNAEADGVSLGSDKAEVAELNMKDEPATETSDPQQTIELVLNGKQELHEDQHIEQSHLAANNVLEGDFQWGRRTLQKFLINFGLL